MAEQKGDNVRLNIAAWEKRSVANGPGERFVLWVQGCPFRCAGCFNQEYLPFINRHPMRVQEVADLIQSVPGIEGVTYSGGEPMAQAKGLYHLSRKLKESGLTVVCYSGYTLDELETIRNPWVQRLTSCLDILIDGRYEETRRANLPWRGSSNQRVHFLTGVYQHLARQANEPRTEIELIIGENRFVSTGILNQDLLKRLEEILNTDAS